MAYAVIIGTISASWNDNNPAPLGTVLFNEALPANPIWDATILPAPGNIREMTAAEIAAQIAANTPPSNSGLSVDNLIDLLMSNGTLTQDQITTVQGLLKVDPANANQANIGQAFATVATPPVGGAAQPAPAIPAAG